MMTKSQMMTMKKKMKEMRERRIRKKWLKEKNESMRQNLAYVATVLHPSHRPEGFFSQPSMNRVMSPPKHLPSPFASMGVLVATQMAKWIRRKKPHQWVSWPWAFSFLFLCEHIHALPLRWLANHHSHSHWRKIRKPLGHIVAPCNHAAHEMLLR